MIRLLSSDEVEIFKAVRLEALRLEPDAYSSSYEKWASLSDGEWGARFARCSVAVAFDGDTPVGVMGILPDGTAPELVMVYLRASHRGSGMAAQMLDRLCDLARSRAARRLVLVVRDGNRRAIRFYDKSGFRALVRWPEDGRDLRMELPLAP